MNTETLNASSFCQSSEGYLTLSYAKKREKRGDVKLDCLIYSCFLLSLSERRKREKGNLIQNYRFK